MPETETRPPPTRAQCLDHLAQRIARLDEQLAECRKNTWTELAGDYEAERAVWVQTRRLIEQRR